MSSEALFCNLSSKKIASKIQSAKSSICFAGPGLQLEPAKALVDVVRAIGPEMITVCLDFDERAMRMGYGDIVAVKLLRDAKITVRNSPGLRAAFFIVDDEGYMFTPTALYLEAESQKDSVPNALRLSRKQITEIQARLSPESKAIAHLLAATPEEKENIASLPLEVIAEEVSQNKFEHVENNLTQLPPAKFDVVRQVRVFEPYLQYVEMSLTGASIQRNKVKIPSDLLNSEGNKDLQGRLNTTFDLIEKNSMLSSKTLGEDLNKIRNNLTPSLGKGYGRVMLKSNKDLLIKRIDEFNGKLVKHKNSVKDELAKHIEESIFQIVNHYVPLLESNPPDSMLGQLPSSQRGKEGIERWLRGRLMRLFPTADSLIQDMKLDIQFKDVTYETLKKADFLELVKKVFIATDWDEAHKEFLAAGEG